MRVLAESLTAHQGTFLDSPTGETVSYSEAAATAARFGSWLRKRGVRRGDTAAIALENSPLSVLVWFGLLREGIGVVPLNPGLPDEEIAYIIRMAEAKIVIGDASTIESAQRWIEEVGGRMEAVNALDRPWDAYDLADEPYVDPEDIAVIFFTSGTTGRPKGAMLTHRALIANATSCAASFDLDGTATFACPIPIFHSFAATVCVFLPALLGGRCYLHNPLDPHGFIKRLAGFEEERIVVGVPSLFHVLAQLSGKGGLKNIRFIVSGGAALPNDIRTALEGASGAPVYEGYGTTECGPVISSQAGGRKNTIGSVGTAVKNVEIEIRSSDGNAVPKGEVGEIVVRTPALMAGYYDLATATKSSIKGGWFYTQDIGYFGEHGELFVVDRLTDVITVKGITVLPQRIETVLNDHPSVLESAVVGVPDGAGGEIPWAFVRPAAEDVDTQQILDYLREQLPIYAVPRGIEFREALPKTITGKILKRTLRQKWL